MTECIPTENDLNENDLEPLAEVEGALLVVEVLHLPHPELGGLLRGREHFCTTSAEQGQWTIKGQMGRDKEGHLQSRQDG